ncbi:hypothetical protein GOP47_0006564 [Adiantum capillus-veneris]|uniref:Uncharacterized protein n=1 Tax=Adiantum capillus-veneris TaxID=13818 RepID=A0A9D4ZKE5_ADICA|nr:hypothetical protein GOP47_0006564 [Adiantum capillus-veneris]
MAMLSASASLANYNYYSKAAGIITIDDHLNIIAKPILFCSVKLRPPPHLNVASLFPFPALPKLVISSMGPPIYTVKQVGANKLHSLRCHSLRLGAAEEGTSSWEDKLGSTSNANVEVVEGTNHRACDSENYLPAYVHSRNRALDEEGNIDNIEQLEQTDYVDRQKMEELMQSHDENASDFNVRTGTDHSSVLTQQWARADHMSGVKDGDKGEIVIKDPQVSPLQEDDDLSAPQLEQRATLGWSEAPCNEGSLLKANTEKEENNESTGGKMQENRLEQLEEEVFQGDGGRTAEDYHRRADLFGRSAEQFAAQKQRDVE